jgi:hypothetical protein
MRLIEYINLVMENGGLGPHRCAAVPLPDTISMILGYPRRSQLRKYGPELPHGFRLTRDQLISELIYWYELQPVDLKYGGVT